MRERRRVWTAVVPALSGVSLLARVRGSAGALITQASFLSVAVVLTDLLAGVTYPTLATTPGATIYDDLQQTDPRWTLDSAGNPGDDLAWGYNFAYIVPAASLPLATNWQAGVVMTPVSGEPFRMPFQWTALAVYG